MAPETTANSAAVTIWMAPVSAEAVPARAGSTEVAPAMPVENARPVPNDWIATAAPRLRRAVAILENLFDPDTVGTSVPRRVQDLPGGAERLVTDAYGIDAVIVKLRLPSGGAISELR